MSPLARLADRAVSIYQKVTAGRPPTCRFDPSCSNYARDAFAAHGALRGGWLALRRVLRCHPWGGQGYDPVPQHDHSHGRIVMQPDERTVAPPSVS